MYTLSHAAACWIHLVIYIHIRLIRRDQLRICSPPMMIAMITDNFEFVPVFNPVSRIFWLLQHLGKKTREDLQSQQVDHMDHLELACLQVNKSSPTFIFSEQSSPFSVLFSQLIRV